MVRYLKQYKFCFSLPHYLLQSVLYLMYLFQTTERFRSRSWKTTAHPGKQKGHTNRGRDAAA